MGPNKVRLFNTIEVVRQSMSLSTIFFHKSEGQIETRSMKIRVSIPVQSGVMLLLGILCSSCQILTAGNSQMPMGTPADESYARKLWSVMEAEKMVGVQAENLEPFIGAAKPHGWILELNYKNIAVDGHTGFVVVKKNYDGTNLTVAQVKADRAQYLTSITIMYQREPGYDPDNKNWFWAKYKANGDLYSKRMKGKQIPMAGRIFKAKKGGNDGGCIYCHKSAGGGDYIFYPEITIPPAKNITPRAG